MRGLLEAFLLESIARQPQHGYAIIRELERVFGATPNRNQVYPMLNRLERDGVLLADRTEGRGKTQYTLTGKGLELLKEYRLRTPEFRQRAAALWGIEERPPPPAEAPPARGPPEEEPPGPHLLDRLAPPDEAPPRAARAGRHTGGGPCAAEVALRRQPGTEHVAIEFRGLDPACPTCRDMIRTIRGVRDQWF